jgi:hypothetical protein
MQRPRRSAKPVTFYDNKLAQEEEVIKKSRLETSKKRRANPLQPVAVEKLPEPLQAAQQDRDDSGRLFRGLIGRMPNSRAGNVGHTTRACPAIC